MEIKLSSELAVGSRKQEVGRRGGYLWDGGEYMCLAAGGGGGEGSEVQGPGPGCGRGGWGRVRKRRRKRFAGSIKQAPNKNVPLCMAQTGS